MTPSWDTAVSATRSHIREELIRQVGRGEVYRSTRDVWYYRLAERTTLYGHFPPITDLTLDAVLDDLLVTGVIRVDHEKNVAGLCPVALAA